MSSKRSYNTHSSKTNLNMEVVKEEEKKKIPFPEKISVTDAVLETSNRILNAKCECHRRCTEHCSKKQQPKKIKTLNSSEDLLVSEIGNSEDDIEFIEYVSSKCIDDNIKSKKYCENCQCLLKAFNDGSITSVADCYKSIRDAYHLKKKKRIRNFAIRYLEGYCDGSRGHLRNHK